jgi:transposase-like protein
MKIKKTSQRRATADQRLQMVEQFRQSGLTHRAFCRQYGVPPATLNWWLKKAKRISNLPVPVPVLFREVKLASPERSFDTGWKMEIIAPSGLTIRCREQFEAQDIAKLIRGEQC